jgi:hypothetical protein
VTNPPEIILQAYLRGEEVPEADLRRLEVWLLWRVSTEMEHVCENLQTIMRSQGIQIEDPSGHHDDR